MNYTHFLGRTEMETNIKNILAQFHNLDKSTKRNIYIRGKSGVGKTKFITRILEEMNYDIIHYDVNETKNNTTLDIITNNTSCNNIISSFKKEKRKHAILIDDTDILCISEKMALTTLIKMVRPKKTKKQQSEIHNTIPIIFVGNIHVDKKIKDLINVCNTFEINPPTKSQMVVIVKEIFPDISDNPLDCDCLVDYIGEDLSKLSLIQEYYGDNLQRLLQDIKTILVRKTKNSDRNQKVQQLYSYDIPLKYHSQFINETDRTTVSLLWHENVIDILKSMNQMPISPPSVIVEPMSTQIGSPKKTKKASPKTKTSKQPTQQLQIQPPAIETGGSYSLKHTLPIYVRILDNICYSDYIDRITFQKQVWKLNEMSSIIKTFKNNHILHKDILSTHENYKSILPNEIRFTKILTKYSSEYNNFWFIRNLCQTLGLDKNDLFNYLIKYLNNHEQLLHIFELNEFDVTTLNRVIKYYAVYTTGVLPKGLAEPVGSDLAVHDIDFGLDTCEF
jgi:hypothetical protein